MHTCAYLLLCIQYMYSFNSMRSHTIQLTGCPGKQSGPQHLTHLLEQRSPGSVWFGFGSRQEHACVSAQQRVLNCLRSEGPEACACMTPSYVCCLHLFVLSSAQVLGPDCAPSRQEYTTTATHASNNSAPLHNNNNKLDAAAVLLGRLVLKVSTYDIVRAWCCAGWCCAVVLTIGSLSPAHLAQTPAPTPCMTSRYRHIF